MEVLNNLRIVDAPGSPLIGESCAPWIDDLASAIFGAYNSDTGERLIQEFFLLISKKNAKSTIAAAIMLTVLIRNWRQSAEFIILAPTIEVANNAYAPARDMIKHDEELSALLHVQDHLRTITHRESGATLKVVAADQNTVGGKKAAVVLVDELHLFGKNPHAANMLREATGGLASRPEGFVIYLTTQSDQPPAGVFREKLQYARGVRDGTIIDPNFLPVIYEFPQHILKANEHRNPENFYITNPNMGYSVSEKFLIREMKKAEEEVIDSDQVKAVASLVTTRRRSDAVDGHASAIGDEQVSILDLARRQHQLGAVIVWRFAVLDQLQRHASLGGHEPIHQLRLAHLKAEHHDALLLPNGRFRNDIHRQGGFAHRWAASDDD